MSLESDIADIMAWYWLEKNPYCGMSASLILDYLHASGVEGISVADVSEALESMSTRGELSTRQAEGDSSGVS